MHALEPPPLRPYRYRVGSAQVRMVRVVKAVGRVALGLVVASALGELVLRPRPRGCIYSESKTDIAHATVKKYAYEAFPAWRRVHPDASCPEQLDELNAFMNNKDIRDPWGGAYRHVCVPAKPRLVVVSAGEDGTFGTDDDVWSDR